MTLAWLLFFGSGILIARFFKSLLGTWFYHHVWMQLAGLILMIAGFVAVLVHFDGKFEPGVHQILGVLVFSMTLLQTIVGLISHLKFDKFRKQPPIFPDKVSQLFTKLD